MNIMYVSVLIRHLIKSKIRENVMIKSKKNHIVDS